MTKFNIPQICHNENCKYFIQGLDLHENGKVSWGFVEFFGEGNQDTMLNVVERINKLYGKEIYSGEVLFEKPSRELLVELELL